MTGGVVEFDTVFSVKYPCVLRTVFLICRDSQLAEDVTQDAFVELLRHWEKVRHHDRPGAWVRRVAIRNLMRVRRREIRRRDAERGIQPSSVAEPADVDVMRALQQVPARQRTALVLYYFETCRSTTSRRCWAARRRPRPSMFTVGGRGWAACSRR